MPLTITSFVIHGLFGYRDVHLHFPTPYKIIVGENGLGKTTIINCLYYTLSKKFDELSKIKFQSIEIHFENEVIEFTHFEIDCLIKRDDSAHSSPFYRLLEAQLRSQDIKKISALISSEANSSSVIKNVISIVKGRGITASASEDYI